METKLTGMCQYRKRLGMALLIGMTAVSTMAWAGPQPLPANGTAIMPSTAGTVTVFNPTGGPGFSFTYPAADLTVISADTLSESFSTTSNVSGGTLNEVVATDSRTGDLDFFIQLTLGTTVPTGQSLVSAVFSELASENYSFTASIGDDVSSGSPGDGGTSNPYSASFTSSADTGIDFSNFMNGNDTLYLGIFTDAPGATMGNLSVTTSGDSSESASVWVPVPETTTLLFGLAIACFIGVQIFRKAGGHALWPVGKSLAV
jgi:hypothetical protein